MTRSPDQSLSDHGGPLASRGLDYPFATRVPEPGGSTEIATGVRWTRSPVPGQLNHINCWIVDDGPGVAVVDAGLDRPEVKSALTSALGGAKVARVVCTHFHPDHVGAAGWLCVRDGARLWMTRGEWLTAKMLHAGAEAEPPAEKAALRRAAGWSEEQIRTVEAMRGWGTYAQIVSPMPASYVRLQDGDLVSLGGVKWRVVVGSGHSPEHACLVDEARRLMVAGDQVLPRITSNVSLSFNEPEADPLGEWLSSIDKLKQLPADLLVLPSHGEPFLGLHPRLARLEKGHRDGLSRLHALLEREPKRAVDCFGALFKRQIDIGVLGLATGETLAHLRHLERLGQAVREEDRGVWWFRAA